jgi:ketosteroid isomerase-like protein
LFELAVGQVVVTEAGRLVTVDQYDPDDREAMLARFAALTADGAELSAQNGTSRADQPWSPERWAAEEVRRYNAHDLQAWSELFAEDYVLVDHRAVGWGTLSGREALRRNTAEALHGAPDINMHIDEVLARDDQVVASLVTYRGHTRAGGGGWELPVGCVTLYRDGRAVSADLYDPDDRDAILARFAELTRQTG